MLPMASVRTYLQCYFSPTYIWVDEVDRWRQGLFSDIDDAVAKFQKNFSKLKEEFQSRSALFLQKTVLDISEYFYSSTMTNSNQQQT
jgi:hypothetical protein